MESISLPQLQSLIEQLNLHVNPLGYECAVFKVKWYNQNVQDKKRFTLSFPEESIAINFISNADLLDVTLKTYYNQILTSEEQRQTFAKNPVNLLNQYYLKEVILNHPLLQPFKREIIFDFDMLNYVPKLLVQTAGHVANQVYYYQRKENDPSIIKYGCAMHPKYGGHFGFRGAIFLSNTCCSELEYQEPTPFLSEEERIQFLSLFNEWNWEYRNVIPVEKPYSKKQFEFFATNPQERNIKILF